MNKNRNMIKMKRIIIFSIVLSVGIALQAQTFTVDGITYGKTSDSTCEVRGTTLVNCVIPPFVINNGISFKVTSLYGYYHNSTTQGAFRGNTTVQSIEIPYTISSISIYAFSGCTSLSSIYYNAKNVTYSGNENCPIFNSCPNISSVMIGDSVKIIPNYFMYGNANITQLLIPDNVEKIDDAAFYECIGLSNISFSNNLRIIGSHAFYGCTGLFDIAIPDTVRTIGNYAFYGCSNLYNLSIGRNIESFGEKAFGNCTSLHNVMYNPRNASYLSTNYLFVFSNSISNLVIGNEVVSIPPCFFSFEPNIHHVIFPEGLTHIGNNAFNNCGLEELVIPSTVTNIGQNAFYNNTNISRIVSFATTPPAIYQSTFSGIPSSVETIVPCGASTEYNIRPWWNGMTNVKESCRYNTVEDTICDGEIYEYGTHSATITGTYHDTLHIDQFVDSMITFQLFVNPSYDYTLTEQICQGQSYTTNGFNENETGIFTQDLQSINGCDSIVRLNLTINPTHETVIDANVCQGNTYSQFGFNTSLPGTHSQNLSTTAGCDSIVHLQLTVNPTYSEHISATITDAQNYQFVDSTLSQSGVYLKMLHTQAGCDSLLTLTLTVIPSVDTLVVHDTVLYPDTIIVVDTLLLHDTTIVHDTTVVVDTMIVYADTLMIHDTIFVTDTIIPCPVYRTYIHASIETGERYSEYGFNVSSAGMYCDTLQTIDGCDSIVCLFLNENVGIKELGQQIISFYPNPASSSITVSIPEGNGNTQICIIDNNGKVVIYKKVVEGENQIDVSTLISGVYYLRIGKTTNKIIIK